jgi:hypothetical protein
VEPGHAHRITPPQARRPVTRPAATPGKEQRRRAITHGVLLSAHPGREDLLAAYEDRVLEHVTDHGGVVLQRLRRRWSTHQPCEVQIIEFAWSEAFEDYLIDPRRVALGCERQAAVVRSDLIEVEPVAPTRDQAYGDVRDRAS